MCKKYHFTDFLTSLSEAFADPFVTAVISATCWSNKSDGNVPNTCLLGTAVKVPMVIQGLEHAFSIVMQALSGE